MSSKRGPGHVPIAPLTLSVDEAAALLGISRAHAYRLIEHGEIYCIRLGARIRIAHTEIERLLTSGRAVAAHK